MADIGQGYRRLIEDATLQLRFPAAAPPPPPPVPSEGPSMLANAGDLFWVVIVVFALTLGAVAVQVIRTRGRPRPASRATASPDAPLDAIHVPAAVLADADALAAAGRYGAAVHALLLRGVTLIQDNFPRALGPSHTSRDIAALQELPPALRTAFAGIAAHTERAVFAQAALDMQDWTACRALYAGLLPTQTRA